VTHSTAADPTKGAVSDTNGCLAYLKSHHRIHVQVEVFTLLLQWVNPAAELRKIHRKLHCRETSRGDVVASENVGVDEKKGRKEKKTEETVGEIPRLSRKLCYEYRVVYSIRNMGKDVYLTTMFIYFCETRSCKA